jgi:hypothetical protein
VPATNLSNIVPKEPAHLYSERPRLVEAMESPEDQTSAPKKPPPPIPRWAMLPTTTRIEPDQTSPSSSRLYPEDVDSPSSIPPGMPIAETVPPVVKRRLTVSPAAKRGIVKSTPKLAAKEQKNSSPQFSSIYSPNPETFSPFDEKVLTEYNQGFDEFAAELADEFVDEFPGAVKNQSGPNSPEKKSARPQLQRTHHVRQLSAAKPLQQEIVISGQSDPSYTGSGSENSDIKIN